MTEKTHDSQPGDAPEAPSIDAERERLALASLSDGAPTMHDEAAPPPGDDARTVHIDLAAFSLTREQVAERYKTAGLDIQPRTVSDYGKRGILRAYKVPAKNGLTRYLFDPTSVDEDIERRKREAQEHAVPTTVHAPAQERPAPETGHGADGAATAHAPSIGRVIHDRDLKIARLETELQLERRERQKVEQRVEREAERALALSHRVGQFQQQIADYKVRIEALEAPKPAQSAPAPPKPVSFLRRLFGRGRPRA
jgi:hypothetical protein